MDENAVLIQFLKDDEAQASIECGKNRLVWHSQWVVYVESFSVRSFIKVLYEGNSLTKALEILKRGE